MRSERPSELAEITETLISGGYDATEGEDGSLDTTWTDFGIVCGIADRFRVALERIAAESECSIGLSAASKYGKFCAYHVARGALGDA